MRLVGHHKIPVTPGQLIVFTQVVVGGHDDALACVLRVLQLADAKPQRISGLDPVGGTFVVRDYDKNVGLPLSGKALDNTQAGERFPRTGAVREEHSIAVGLCETVFCFLHVLLLAGQQVGQRVPNVLQVTRDDL